MNNEVRKQKITWMKDLAKVINTIIQKYEPCKERWKEADEETRRNEFYKASSLYYDLNDLCKTLVKMSTYSEMILKTED